MPSQQFTSSVSSHPPPRGGLSSAMSLSGHSSLSTGLSSSNPNPSSAAANPKARQYSHLHSRLATLNAHLADLENLVRMTSVQAGDVRFLGGYVGGLFMGASKVLGEEGVVAGRKEGGGEGGREA